MRHLITALLFLAAAVTAQAGAPHQLEVSYLSIPYGTESIEVRVGVKNPDGPVIGDVLYIHGFGDRLDNHAPLFDAWADAGLRVIAFDLPSHGEDKGSYNNLNNFDFKSLAHLVAQVEQYTKSTDNQRPLILSGWSTGALIVVRMIQEQWTSDLSRPVAGVILIAPGISVRKFPWTFGNRWGQVTQESLTHNPNPPHVGPIQPNSPFWNRLVFKFAPDLVLNSILSQLDDYPSNLPTLVFIAGDKEDVYAKSWVTRDWVKNHPNMIGVQCPHSRHEMDNELPKFGAEEVKAGAATFAARTARGEMTQLGDLAIGKICNPIR